MGFKNIFFFIIAVSLSSCEWGVPGKKNPAITKDTLVYTYQNFKERAPDCGDKPDSSCTIVKVTYPEFKGQKTLNDSVTGKFNEFFRGNKKADTNLKQITTRFMSGYKYFRKDQPKSTLNFLLDAHAKILRQDSGMLTIEVEGYTYTGGAHGENDTYFINWDTKANKNILLRDILIDGYNGKLTQVAEQIFRKQEKLSDTSSLATNYFFKGNKFSLPDNYLVTPLGIKFLYNVYTIKPYAAGQTELFVPYSQIKSFIKPNTVLSQFVK
ncbi:MAG: hypothetical protein JWP37_130 [Mucilaginibacter sp.]|nr:hypothetical protein [Mucilaginibacter sp.]